MKLAESFNYIDDKFIVESEKKHNFSVIKGIVAMAACLCLVLCGLALMPKDTELPIDSESGDESIFISSMSEFDDSFLNDRLLFSGLTLNATNVQIKETKTLTKEELFEYYGYRFDLKEVFEGIHEKPSDYSIRVGVDGIIHSDNTFGYHLGNKKISVGIRKGEGELNTDTFKGSFIRGKEVLILDYGEYLISYFNHSGNLISVASAGFSQDEFVKTISYLVEINDYTFIEFVEDSIYINPASYEFHVITHDKVEELDDGRLLYTFMIEGIENCVYGEKGEEPPTLKIIDRPITRVENIKE